MGGDTSDAGLDATPDVSIDGVGTPDVADGGAPDSATTDDASADSPSETRRSRACCRQASKSSPSVSSSLTPSPRYPSSTLLRRCCSPSSISWMRVRTFSDRRLTRMRSSAPSWPYSSLK